MLFIVIYLLFTETPYFSLSLTMSLSGLAMQSRACVFILLLLRTFPSINRNKKKACRHKHYLKIIIIQMQWNMEAMSNYVDFNSIIVKVGRKSTHKLIRNSFDCDNSMSHRQFRCLLPQCQMLEYISLIISLVLPVLVFALKMRKKRETTQCDSVGNVSTNSNRTNSFV